MSPGTNKPVPVGDRQERRRLWLIDAGYLFNGQRSAGAGYQFDYLKLRNKLEASGPLWRAYYLNSTPHPPTDAQDAFHTWLRSATPRGPQLITKLYELKQIHADRAYCEQCGDNVSLTCPTDATHSLHNQQQKGVDVGLATLETKLGSVLKSCTISIASAGLPNPFGKYTIF